MGQERAHTLTYLMVPTVVGASMAVKMKLLTCDKTTIRRLCVNTSLTNVWDAHLIPNFGNVLMVVKQQHDAAA